MIVIASDCTRMQECAAEIQSVSGERVRIVASLQECKVVCSSEDDMESTRVLVIDEPFCGAFADTTQELLTHFVAAIPVSVNSAIHSKRRIVRDVSLSLERQRGEQLRAIQAARAILQRELAGMVTAIVLNAQIALQGKETPTEAGSKLREICQIAQQIQLRLQPAKAATLNKPSSTAAQKERA